MTYDAKIAEMEKSLASFTAKIERFKTAPFDAFIKAYFDSITDLFSKIVAQTPVDTGRAKLSWQLDFNEISQYLPPASKQTGIYLAAAQQNLDAQLKKLDLAAKKTDGTWFIYSNVQYMKRLEFDGWSPQRANGWIRKNVIIANSQFEKILNRRLREAGL